MRLLLFVALVGGLGFYATAGSGRSVSARSTRPTPPKPSNRTTRRSRTACSTCCCSASIATRSPTPSTKRSKSRRPKRLTRVPVESAVDRTQLLRLGYVLVVIVAAVALYKIFSPKDPFITAERVLMPWADIVPASRVSIENVEPGATTLARGEVLTVSADVRGIGEDDPVVVRYTTADGQAVDMPAPMKPSAAGLRFTGQIPPASDGAPAGVAQDLRYRIEAGDARSREYAVTVVAAPTITVERIDYDYPDYTGFADRSVERLGDIRAIEGTRVTIHARANEPIEEAAIDFEADGRRDIVTQRRRQRRADDVLAGAPRRPADAQVHELRAPLHRRRRPAESRPREIPDRRAARLAARKSRILAPAEKVRDVRLDETVAIEVEARDPDFALAEVRLAGRSGGTQGDRRAAAGKRTHGPFHGRLLFTPNEHDLQPGDVVRYWVTARDNRAPQPNEATSDSQTLRIVSPDPKQPGQPPQDRIAQREQREQQGGDQSQEGEQQSGRKRPIRRRIAIPRKAATNNNPASPLQRTGKSGQSGEQNSAEQSGETVRRKSIRRSNPVSPSPVEINPANPNPASKSKRRGG